MARENIYEDLQVFYEQIEACPMRNRAFNFFELVYVLSGTGAYVVNENTVDFKKGDLFITTPRDKHEFNLEKVCEFIVVRFSQQFIQDYQSKTINHIECLLYHASHLSSSLIQNEKDQHVVDSLMITLRECLEDENIYQDDLIRQLVNAIIVVAGRNLTYVRPQEIKEHADTRILEIINYIQINIYAPEQLKVVVIANRFGLSETYLGAYFKRQCGESIQHFITNYRIRLIEQRLLFSDKRIVEIVEEFGFTDESHINKFFKRHKQMSLSEYRKTTMHAL